MAPIIYLCPEILGSQQKFVLLSVSDKLLKIFVEKNEPKKDQICWAASRWVFWSIYKSHLESPLVLAAQVLCAWDLQGSSTELSVPGEPRADTAVANRSLRWAERYSPQSGAAADRPRPPCRPEWGAWWQRPAGSERLGQQPASWAGSRDRWWTPLLTPAGPDLQKETHFLRLHHNTQRKGSQWLSISYFASHKYCQQIWYLLLALMPWNEGQLLQIMQVHVPHLPWCSLPLLKYHLILK